MTVLKLNDLSLWRPPIVTYELVGSKNNYTSSACGSILDSTDLRYRLFISHLCSLAESQEIQLDIEDALSLAPNLTLYRQETPDALLFQNKIRKGTLDLSSNQDEIRARFTRNRTLAFELALTILPTGAGSGDAPFRHIKYLAATGALSWETDTISALLIDEDSSVFDELYVKLLNGFVDLSELTGGSYTRQTLTGLDVVEGSIVQLLADDPTFDTTGASSQATGMVIFQDNGSDATNVPLFLIGFPETSEGSNQVHIDLSGLF